MSQVGSETWSVVKFPEENSVTAVPTSWLNGTTCFWPPFSRKVLQAAIERGDPPNTKTWQQFEYLALRNNVFDSFKEAERKSRKALQTSDLESQIEDNDDGESIGKRKRRIPKHFDDDHSSSEDENTLSDLPKPPKPPMFKKRPTIQKPIGNIKIVQSHSQPQQISNTFDNVNIASTSTFHEDSIRQSPTTSNRELCELQNSMTPHVENHNCGDIGGYLKQILRKQNILQCMVTDLNTKLIEIENFVKTTRSHETENAAVEVGSIFVKVQNLPVDSEDALQELENFLADQNEFNEAVKKIMKLGGNSTYEFIFRAAKKLITDRFAGAEFSFLGRKQKRKFIDLKLAQLLKNAALNLFQQTEKEVENNIAKWLRKCTDRAKKIN